MLIFSFPLSIPPFYGEHFQNVAPTLGNATGMPVTRIDTAEPLLKSETLLVALIFRILARLGSPVEPGRVLAMGQMQARISQSGQPGARFDAKSKHESSKDVAYFMHR
jgi:hypothetical protein